jgi:hypothetical protein
MIDVTLRPPTTYRTSWTRPFLALVAFGLLCPGYSLAQDAAPDSMTQQALPSATAMPPDLLSSSSQFLADGNYEMAIRDASLAIHLDPHNAAAYEMRGSIYIEEKLWDRAERDYAMAEKASPDIVYKYKLAEIKFLQQSYDDARPRFLALESDPRLGDLCVYKVFLCDLLDDREAAADKDLQALDQVTKNPSYYYCNGAWNLYHSRRAEAGKFFAAAGQLYDSSTQNLYVSSLVEAQRLHLTVATFVAKDGKTYDHASMFLESDGLRVSTPQGWVTLPVDQLPDDLSALPADLREQIDQRRAVLPESNPPLALLSFTTKDGKSFEQVRWTLADTGLSILTTDGWLTVPFGQLPSDLSSFPSDLQRAIEQKREISTRVPVSTALVTFTTKRGKKYDEVRTSLRDDGLSVLTTNGWITVPYGDLPDDLSSFPPEWRSQILEQHRRSAEDDPLAMHVISFTTKKGRHYDQVRASIETNGLRLVTSDGLIAVSFDQLPADLSAFPEVWREKIGEKQARLAQSKPPVP